MKVKSLILILVSTGLLIWLGNKVGIEKIYSNILQANLAWLLCAIVIIPIIIIIRIVRWHYLVGIVVRDLVFLDSAKSFLVGSLLAIITPAKVGDLARDFYFTHKRTELATLIVFEKITDLFLYLALSIFMAFKLRVEFGFTLFLISLILLLLIMKPSLISRFISVSLPLFLQRKLFVAKSLSSIKIIKNISVPLLLISIIIALLTVLQFYIIINAFSTVGLSVIFMVFPLTVLMASLPVSFGGIGVREGTAIYLLSMFNVPKEASVNASLCFYLLNILPFLCGIMFFPRVWDSLKKLYVNKKT